MKKSFLQIFNERSLFFPIIINSTVAYIFAFIATYIVYQFTTIIAAASCGINVRLFFNRVDFITPDTSPLWSFDSALLVFSSGPAISLILGAISLLFCLRYMNDKRSLKILFLWISIHFFSRILSFFIFGNIFFLYGPNLIIDWLYLGEGFRIILSAIAFMLMIITGRAFAGMFMHSANNINLIQMPRRLSFLLSQMIIPYLAGSIIIFLIFVSGFHVKEIIEILISLSMIICLLPIIINYKRYSVLHLEESIEVFPVERQYIYLTVGLIILFRLVLIKGISF